MTTPPTFPAEFSNVRGGESGFRVARHNTGQWWWINPRDQAQVVCGVHGLDASVGALPADAQVGQWGINLLLPPIAEGFCGTGLPYLRDMQLSRCGAPAIHEEGVYLPDVFDPVWAETIEQVFNAVVPTPMLAGWLGDSELRWGSLLSPNADSPATRPGLLQVCLGLDPAYRAYHSAWEFVLARHGGELEHVGKAWGIELSGRGAVRQCTRDERVFTSAAYGEDLTAFVAEFAQRYFNLVHDAARRVNAGCLLFSPLMNGSISDAVLSAAIAASDVILTTVPGSVGGEAPQIRVDYNWARSLPAAASLDGESVLEATLRTGRQDLTTILSRPEMIGYAWAPFRRGDLAIDDPFGVGLVDENGRENPVHTHPIAAINSASALIRSSAT